MKLRKMVSFFLNSEPKHILFVYFTTFKKESYLWAVMVILGQKNFLAVDIFSRRRRLPSLRCILLGCQLNSQ